MRLLIINDAGIEGGGTENRIRLLTEELLKRKVFEEIHLLQLKKNDKNNSGYFSKPYGLPDGIISHYVTSSRKTYAKVKSIILQYKITLVQAHNMLGLTPLGIFAAYKLKVPIIWFAHDYWVLCGQRSFIKPDDARHKELCEGVSLARCLHCMSWRSVLRLKMFQRIIQKVNLAVSATHFMVDMFERHKILKGKWRVLRPWVSLDIFSKADVSKNNQRQDIIFTGSLADYKGAWVAAEALKYVVEEIPQVKLRFVGGNQDKDNQHRKRIESICLRDNTFSYIEFLGQLSWMELSDLYYNAGAYICPTICMESFGLNWAEAMATGCPVVASDIGSVSELVADKGILVPPRDAKELAKAVTRLLKDKDYAFELKRSGQHYARKSFDIGRAVDELIEVYDTLTKS